MQAKRWLMLSGLVVAFALVCSSGQAAAQAGQPVSPDPDLAPAAFDWTVDQLVPLSNGAASVVASDAPRPDRQLWAADDFAISPGAGYAVVRQVSVAGYNSNISGATVNVFFYDASGSLPASNSRYSVYGLTPVGWGSGLSVGNFYVSLVAYLPRGNTYWVSVQVNVGTGVYWYWAENALHGTPSAWKAIGDPYCSTWGARVDYCLQPYTGSIDKDLAFRLEGNYVTNILGVYLPVIKR